MIDNVHYMTNEIAENASRENAPSKSSDHLTSWQTPQAVKLSRADLHIHSTFSDGIPTIEQILEHTEHYTNLDVIAITDHNTLDGSLRARDLWTRGSYRFDFVVGEEISTNEGHLLALFIEKHIPPHISIERSIDLVHKQGGLAIIVHPLNPFFRMSCQREVLDRIYANNDLWLDGIETWNAGLCGIIANRVAMLANREIYGWPEVGNSDAHTLPAIGRGCTLFQGTTAADVRTAIQAGLSAPGGKMWHVHDYLRLASYHINKRRSSSRQPAA
jgi:predicted metal-dependent phosphoesterase TrpH